MSPIDLQTVAQSPAHLAAARPLLFLISTLSAVLGAVF